MRIIRAKGRPFLNDGDVIWMDDHPFRILSHKQGDDGKWFLYILDLDATCFKVSVHAQDDLLTKVNDGSIRGAETEIEPMPYLDDGASMILNFRFRIIKNYVDSLYPDYLWLQRRGCDKGKLADTAKTLGISPKRVRQLVFRYLKYGGSLIALIDQRSYKSGVSSDKAAVRGRKSASGSSKVMNDAILEDHFEEAYRNFRATINQLQYGGKTVNKPTLQGAYNAMIWKYYTRTDERGAFILLPEDQRPSYDRFYRWVRTTKNHSHPTKQLKSSLMDSFNNNRLLTGNSSYNLTRPCQLVEIDAHELPLVSISSIQAGRQVTGKAVLYAAIDALTHCLVGMHIMMQVNNSYEGFLNLMDSMLMADSEIAYMNGVQAKDHAVFPGPCVPEQIRVDHGAEYVSHALRENLTGGRDSFTLRGLPIQINLAPPGTGSMKGLVEGYFSVLDRRIQEALGSKHGFVSHAKKSKHYKKAVLTLEHVRQIAYEVAAYYNTREMTEYPVTPEMAAVLPSRSPLCIWDYYKGLYGLSYSIETDMMRNTVRAGLLPNNRTFKLSRRQISYRDLLYYDIGSDEGLIARAKVLGNRKETLDVRYDPRSVDRLYRFGEDGSLYVYLLASKRDNMRSFAGWSWYMVDSFCEQEREKKKIMKKKNEEKKVLSHGNVKMIADAAERAADLSKPAIQKDITEAGTIERIAATHADSRKRDMIFGEDVPVLPAMVETDDMPIAEMPITEEMPKEDSASTPFITPEEIAAAFGITD